MLRRFEGESGHSSHCAICLDIVAIAETMPYQWGTSGSRSIRWPVRVESAGSIRRRHRLQSVWSRRSTGNGRGRSTVL